MRYQNSDHVQSNTDLKTSPASLAEQVNTIMPKVRKEAALENATVQQQLSMTADIEVDEFLVHVGEFGLMQKLLVVIFSLLIIPNNYQTLIMTFIGNNPSWQCTRNNTECIYNDIIDKNDDRFKTRCEMERLSWEYTQPKEFSIVTEWDLVCKNNYMSYFANSAMFVGWIFGSLFFGWLSDKFGRKMSLFPALALCIATSFAMAFSPDFWLFFALRIIIGIAQGGVFLTAVIMASELVGSKYRSIADTVLFFSVTVTLCLAALQSWLVTNWRTLLIITSAPYVILLPACLVVPESIRWLRLNGKRAQAENILKRLAIVNNKPWPNCRLSISPKHGNDASAKYLFTPKNMAISNLIQCFGWFVVVQVYYGISLASDNLGGSIYRDFVLTSIIEIPGNLLVMYTFDRFGRRPSMCGSMILSGLSCFGVAFIPSTGVYKWIRISFGMIGKLFITLAYSGFFIWSVELYPTVIRSEAMGLLSVAGRIGAAGAPWIAQYLGYINRYLPFVVMGTLMLICGVLCLKLDETAGVAMTDTLESSSKHISKPDSNGTTIKNEFVDTNINMNEVIN